MNLHKINYFLFFDQKLFDIIFRDIVVLQGD